MELRAPSDGRLLARIVQTRREHVEGAIQAAGEAFEVTRELGDAPSFRIGHMPYGGVNDSGLGREGVRCAIEEMTERKILVMNIS